MSRPFDIAPQTVVVGNVTLSFYNDPDDAGICKMQVAASASQTNTLVQFTRAGDAITGSQTTTIPARDSLSAGGMGAQIGSGGHRGSHNAGFGV